MPKQKTPQSRSGSTGPPATGDAQTGPRINGASPPAPAAEDSGCSQCTDILCGSGTHHAALEGEKKRELALARANGLFKAALPPPAMKISAPRTKELQGTDLSGDPFRCSLKGSLPDRSGGSQGKSWPGSNGTLMLKDSLCPALLPQGQQPQGSHGAHLPLRSSGVWPHAGWDSRRQRDAPGLMQGVPGSHPCRPNQVPWRQHPNSHNPKDAAHPAQARLCPSSSSSSFSCWTIVPEPAVGRGRKPHGEWQCPPSSPTGIHSILLQTLPTAAVFTPNPTGSCSIQI